MSQLAELQSAFQSYLSGATLAMDFERRIQADGKISASRRLAIYHDAYRLRLIEALATSYPMLFKLLGDQLFQQLAQGYVAQYPSAFRNLRWYGAELADYLGTALPQHPVAAELADFEWQLAHAFDAPDTALLQLADLAAVPAEDWAGLRFELQPSVRQLPLRWNTIAMWHALNQEQEPPSPVMLEQAEPCLIWRQQLDAHFCSLDAVEACAFRLLQSGASFAEICDGVALHAEADDNETVMVAARLLANWLEQGLICRFYR
ncbi:HvfC/BufC N-terminal domain-containing protein [Methylobacillus flagellatus]|uniref:HvfC/BufC N-terminal domain-containing protein n=1 Tax=Methylobacillus flagellatus TaxID=405 RepID=UPI0010F90CDC|nr:putative DNA-binding domain-containing protein [Methylobacillus flagellatus]